MPTEKPARASGVSAAEKYAELEARGEERPKCECHDQPKCWTKRTGKPAGGSWICAEKARAGSARYFAKNPEKVLASSSLSRKKYPEKTRARSRRYYRRHREMMLLKAALYRQKNLEKVRARTVQWRKSNPEKVQEAGAARYAYRKGAGLCVMCGGERDRPSLTCQSCTDYQRDWARLHT